VVLWGRNREGFSRSLPPNGVKCRIALKVLSLPKTMPVTFEQFGPLIKLQY